MKEYISKEYINNLLEYLMDRWCGPEYDTCSTIQDEINGAPDSAVVYMYECSHCESMTSEEHRYCPYCGKPMEVADSNGN